MPVRSVSFSGGKGGTGKSTVATNVVALLSMEKKVVMADMDVECPNDYILLSVDKLRGKESVKLFNPIFVPDKCTKCGDCKEACAENAIVQFKGGMPFLLPQLCSGCRVCQLVCKDDAIADGEKVVGYTYVNDIKFGNAGFTLVTGLLNEGEERSFPVAQSTKNRALGMDAEIHVFDTAAGTTNTVAISLVPSEMLIAVSEPTPLGIHDMEMILSLSEKMGIKPYIVVNKANLGGPHETKAIDSLVDRYGAEVIARIPYDRSIVNSYVKGIPYVLTRDAEPAVVDEYRKIAEVILR